MERLHSCYGCWGAMNVVAIFGQTILLPCCQRVPVVDQLSEALFPSHSFAFVHGLLLLLLFGLRRRT